MATLKQWLTDSNFDWESGRILFQWHDGEENSLDDWETRVAHGWSTPDKAEVLATDSWVLTYEFYDGHGGPEAPRILAEDGQAFYFCAQYDGATWLEKLYKDVSVYKSLKAEIPYPGG